MSGESTYLSTLAQEAHTSEAAIVALALDVGLRQLWRERTLSRYVRGQITRDEAIESAGIDWVALAERQHAAMRDDLEWALGTELGAPTQVR